MGKVALLYIGEYDAEKTYEVLDFVGDGKSTWFSKQDGNKGNALPTTIAESKTNEWWGYLANGDLADAAAALANAKAALAADAANEANKATTKANAAATNCANEQTKLKALKSELEEATEAANGAATAANAKAEEVQTLSESLVQQVYPAPTIMKIEAPTEISTHNNVAQAIKVTLLPSYVGQNFIFQCADGSSLKVDPNGKLTVNGIGETSFYVIPTANRSLWQEVTINVRAPKMRLANGKIRLSATGKARIV